MFLKEKRFRKNEIGAEINAAMRSIIGLSLVFLQEFIACISAQIDLLGNEVLFIAFLGDNTF